MKKLIRVVAVLFLLVILVVGAAFLYIDQIARTAIEQGSTQALGVPTALDSADVGLTSGTFALGGLTVSNPTGYETAHFLSLADGSTEVDFASLRSEVVELPALNLSGIDVNLEKRNGKANYDAILDNLKTFQGEGGDPGETAEEGTGFVIRTVTIKDVTVHADLLPIGGSLTRTDLHIDELVLENLGTAGDPLPMGKLVTVIVQAIMVAIVEKGVALPAELLQGLGSGLEQLVSLDDLGVAVEGIGGALEGAAEDIGNIAGELGGEAGKAAEGIGKVIDGALKGVGGLLGGDDK